MKTRTALEGVGAALLLLLPCIWMFIGPSNMGIYFHRLPATTLVGGFLVDFLGFSILTIGFLVATQYLPLTLHRILIALFAGLLICGIVEFIYRFLPVLNHLFGHWPRVRTQSIIAIPLLSGTLAYFLPRITQPVVRAVRLVLAAFAFSTLWIVPQLLHLALVRQPVQSAAPNHLSAFTSSGSNRRIIWILFDELSYHQTFDHPALGIQLPNFDLLHAGSISFSNLKPAGYSTGLIIPSLLLGCRIDQIRSTTDGELWYDDESQRRWLAYDPNVTLFGLAQRSGWNTGVDGWMNPYCRILAPVINVCSWEPQALPLETNGASEDKSMLANAVVIPGAMVSMLIHHNVVIRNAYILVYRNLMAHARTLIDDNQVRFVFLHLNVPHAPGIYDRKRHMMLPSGTYLDNLVLADDTLGALLQEIYATPSASQTTVIVSSDHSWRISEWRHSDYWSDEEERASGGGRFDDRPVLLIHFPGQKSGNDINAALPELLEHDIIAGMLLGRINNPEDLAVFLAQHGR